MNESWKELTICSWSCQGVFERSLLNRHLMFPFSIRWKLQLEQTERNLSRRERQLNLQSSKIHYKKKPRPFLQGKSHDRFQSRASQAIATVRSRKSSPSTPEVLSTSPESPFKLDTSTSVAAAASGSVTNLPRLPSHLPASTPIVVRANPVFNLPSRDISAQAKRETQHSNLNHNLRMVRVVVAQLAALYFVASVVQ